MGRRTPGKDPSHKDAAPSFSTAYDGFAHERRARQRTDSGRRTFHGGWPGKGDPLYQLVSVAKIGDRFQIAQQKTNTFGRFNRANLAPVTDFHAGLAVSRQKPTKSESEINS